MRKLALLLGSLLVVASASAKEVVPAPVVVEEAPVQVIEKEVIVYRDKEVGFRPNGNVDLQYRYYGDTEGQNKGTWHGGDNNYSRIQLSGKINMTEKQQLQYRIRNWNSLNEKENQMKTETRFRYFYNHGLLGDSKVNFTSRVHYLKGYSDEQELQYEAEFNFADYMFNNDYVKTTDFTVAPMYRYGWDSNSDTYDNQLGVSLYTNTKLPFGFNLELNFYATQHFYGKDQLFDYGKDKDDKNFTVDMELYLTNNVNLYATEKHSVDFTIDMGYDDYSWSDKKMFKSYTEKAPTKDTDILGTDNTEYKLYARPGIKYTYKVTPAMSVFGHVEAEYANFKYSNENSARDFRWQALATVGMRTTF